MSAPAPGHLPRAEIGLIGGSGLYTFFARGQQVEVSTPYGPPSDPISIGEVAGRAVAFLPRHGHDHRHPPHRVPYLANAWALASLGVLEEAGWEWVHSRAAGLAAGLAEQLAARGLQVGPRGRSTLVAWEAADPEAEVARLAEQGFVVRSIATHSLVRVSVGAWSSEDELAQLAELARA